ncbi:MAG TPA: SIR2 family protein [Thermoanaerobaculia bacterium]|nr:SIR2 family protein [Thermoanaerobaculia bacterium]
MARQRTQTEAVRIQQLAGELIALQTGTGPGATVLLGAGASVASQILTWGSLAKELCSTLSLDTTETEPELALIEYLHDWRNPYGMRQKIFQKHLKHRLPSIGYSHLAQLVKDRFVTTILTTNWDTLLEKALFRVLSIDDVKILIRGEVPDDVIAASLASRHREGHPTVVKLHGDIQSGVLMLGDDETRSFDDKIGQAVRDCLSGTTFVVGQSARDADILTALLGAKRVTGTLYYVRYDSSELATIDQILRSAQAKIVTGTQKGVIADGEDVKIGSFDNFFTQLDLAVQVLLVTERREQLQLAESSIIEKEATGIGYINYTRITELVRLFTLQVKKLKPQIVLFIEDPSAPGGVELQRRMLPIMRDEKMEMPTATIRIQGKGGSRTHKRSVETDLSTLDMTEVDTALILDSITFSGNTLKLARDAIRDQYPNIDVHVGVLVISQQLAERQPARAARTSDTILHQTVTDRYEIFFPWGVTQTTASFSRKFVGAVDGEGREVRIERRPWGTIEILADQEITSVRLLTIEAQRRLSFQRHLCRDELFVALDDNIGLDISAEDLDRNASEYDERVKSLILEKGDYVLVPRGVWHRTKASMDRVRLLELGFGLYDQHNDIERRWDDYEREHKDGTT